MSSHVLHRLKFLKTFIRLENQAGQGVDLDPERTKLHEQRLRGVQLTVFWSRAQHHVTTSLMKLAVGERNVATNLGIIIRFC